MSPSLTLSLAALAVLAAPALAIPHSGHSRFHAKPSGYPVGSFPSGGWKHNNTRPAHYPTGTGAASLPADSEPTTTVIETQFSTLTIVSTIYGNKAASSQAAVVADYSPVDGPACGPSTVYVTATAQVTVTLPSAPPSSVADAVSSAPASSSPSSSAPAASAPAYTPPAGYPVNSVSFVFPSSVNKPVEQPSSSPAPLPSSSKAAAPVYSAAPVQTPSASPSPYPVEQKTSVVVAVSSAPAAKPSAGPASTPSYGTTNKRGLAYNNANLCNNFANGKFGAAYNWGQVENGELPTGVKYIPMMHKPSDSTAQAWLANVDKAVKKGSDAVMGFNEPDHAEQANLSPSAACDLWKTYMNPIATSHPSVTIMGPSITNGGGSMGFAWLDSFVQLCSDATFHQTNIHFYDQYDSDVINRFKKHVDSAVSKYGKPVQVTEFGLNPGTASQEQAAQFLKDAMSYLESNSNVKGYYYFMVGTGENQLNAGTGLSVVGNAYVA